MINRMLKAAGVVAVLVVLWACSGDRTRPVTVGSSADTLMGGGSSFVYPVMNRWAYDYYKSTGVQVNYQSLGSSGGIKQFSVETLVFGATDAPMNAEQIKVVNGNVLHIPIVMGGVAVTYNLPGVKEQLTLTGELIADIYLGKVRKWNDAAIAELNPGVTLPAEEIVTVRRADGSGTTFIFADFLAKRSAEWERIVGVGNSLSWPAGSIGAKGNEGVAAQVNRSPYSMGYVELVYALESHLEMAAVVNKAGKAVLPSIKSVTAAAAEITTMPESLCMSITDPPGDEAYPIGGISWVVARRQMTSPETAAALRQFLTYILSDPAQSVATTMNYSRLPKNLLEAARHKVSHISGTAP